MYRTLKLNCFENADMAAARFRVTSGMALRLNYRFEYATPVQCMQLSLYGVNVYSAYATRPSCEALPPSPVPGFPPTL